MSSISDSVRRLFYVQQQALHGERRKANDIADACRAVVAVQCQDRNAGALGIYLRLKRDAQQQWNDIEKLVSCSSNSTANSTVIRSWSMRHTLHAFHIHDAPLMAAILEFNQYAHRKRWHPGQAEFEEFKDNLVAKIDATSS